VYSEKKQKLFGTTDKDGKPKYFLLSTKQVILLAKVSSMIYFIKLIFQNYKKSNNLA
jgi:hypothetical protein